MGRSNNHKPSSSKNSLPQTPKNLKIEPDRVDDEFSRELGESGKIRATRPK
ncbi:MULTISPECIES: YfhD family protein [Metabacillus]|uniref:YfhD family protein n=1 Tax=Metabacillus hrfriensis TaxID=3048891 RepID=A0ACD4R6G2_9BACI|nr:MULTISPECIES: YfhD family protein [Metabacillus]UAL50570.1 YfhD family protein [Metabacillus dongyingensis]UOK56645.1 YfhD family protein [Bacillus sp. OVS6]USK26834.1 YfhD family protein [Bacillus sp. CMF21]WHZ56062.1 YfhD family protein [Metabacillus sp. CT-WN-B3]